jgi:hypothetical protein
MNLILSFHLKDIYGVKASASIISRITDKIMPQIIEWQSRPLDKDAFASEEGANNKTLREPPFFGSSVSTRELLDKFGGV